MTLLLVTAVVSGLLVLRLTQQWQDHQQALDTGRYFAGRVARTVGEIFVATQIAQSPFGESQSQEEFDNAYKHWEVESAVLGAELRAYYRAESLPQAWDQCYRLTTAYYAQAGIPNPTRRASYLQEVHDDLDLPDNVDRADIGVLRATILRKRDQVIREVIDSAMK